MKPYEMSSSSSRDEFESCWPYETKYVTNYRNAYGSHHPFYPTMGQPLIYCSQDVCTCDIPPQPIKHRSRDQRRGPNCFVKAFRWYTQEHVPSSNKSTCRPNHDMSSFAAWLDVKYDQFLEESQKGSEMYHVKVKQTFEAERGPGPLKKKRRAKSNEGITQQRSNHSCHYIMKPKENISRPPSVSCHTSRATTAGSDFANKSICKAHSFSNVTLTIRNKDVDDATAQGDIGDNCRGDDISCKTCKAEKPKPNASATKTYSNTSMKKVEIAKASKFTSCHEVYCQCSQEVESAHAQTQYDTAHVKVNSVVSYKSECPDCGCQTTEKEITVTSSKLTVRPLESVPPCEQGTASCECIPVNYQNEDKVTLKPVIIKESSRTATKVYKNVECQCVIPKAVTIDAQTQYVESAGNANNKCACNFKGSVLADETAVPSVPSSSTRVCPCKGKVKEGVMGDQTGVKFVQTTAQTSNHSICIENKSPNVYPLFLKIVCADKLSREKFK